MRTVNLSISASHPALAGHFPGIPIVPGVVLLDEVIHALTSSGADPAQHWEMAATKFHSAVRPGEKVMLEHDLSPDGSTRFVIRTADRTVASGKLTSVAIARNPDLEA